MSWRGAYGDIFFCLQPVIYCSGRVPFGKVLVLLGLGDLSFNPTLVGLGSCPGPPV